jgi:cobalt-zinc-cadmium efflux system protein
MAADHHHESGVGPLEAQASLRAAFFLNLLFTGIEVGGGLLTNSVAILSNAVHDLGDGVALAVSWRLEHLSTRGRTREQTYGYRRFSLLGALVSGAVLALGSAYILAHAIPRLFAPQPVHYGGMAVVAVLGVVVNALAVLRLRGGRKLNQRVVALHLLEDVLGWLAVLIGSAVMALVEVPILDPILSIAITGYVLSRVVPRLRSASRVFLQYAPEDADLERIAGALRSEADVADVHHLHLWSLDGHYTIFSGHVVVDGRFEWPEIESLKRRLRKRLEALGVEHATLELEPSERACPACDL